MTLDEAVLEVMRGEPQKEWDLDSLWPGVWERGHMGVGLSSRLSVMARDGRVVRVRRGVYSLPREKRRLTWE